MTTVVVHRGRVTHALHRRGKPFRYSRPLASWCALMAVMNPACVAGRHTQRTFLRALRRKGCS